MKSVGVGRWEVVAGRSERVVLGLLIINKIDIGEISRIDRRNVQLRDEIERHTTFGWSLIALSIFTLQYILLFGRRDRVVREEGSIRLKMMSIIRGIEWLIHVWIRGCGWEESIVAVVVSGCISGSWVVIRIRLMLMMIDVVSDWLWRIDGAFRGYGGSC